MDDGRKLLQIRMRPDRLADCERVAREQDFPNVTQWVRSLVYWEVRRHDGEQARKRAAAARKAKRTKKQKGDCR